MLRLLENLDERQVRLGYVNCLVLMAGRHLDNRQGLRRRFDAFVFRKVYEGDLEGQAFLQEIDDEGRRSIGEQDRQRQRVRGGSKTAQDPAAALRRVGRKESFRYVSHLWLAQKCMVSRLGPLAPERSEVFLEHAKHLGLLAETYALTETGGILKQLLLEHDSTMRDGKPVPNPMNVRCRLAVQVLYLWAVVENDALTPFLLRELLSRKNDAELLQRAASALVESFARGASIDAALELRRLREYSDRVGKGDKIHRHHIRPRLEHYVDLGLIARRAASHDADSVYGTDATTIRAVAQFEPLLSDPRTLRRFQDSRFFSAVAATYGLPATATTDQHEILWHFARGFELVGREIGFTPGRTVAIAGSLLALEKGCVIEVDQMFEAVRAAAASPLGEHLIFSGGSRLDREFLIRVLPELTAAITRRSNADTGKAIS